MNIYFFIFLFFYFFIFIEGILYSIWSVAFFKAGIPIYKKVCDGSPVSFAIINDCKIETLMPESKPGKILIKYIRENYFIFREHAYRFKYFIYGSVSIMHGGIVIEPQKGQVIVIGKLSWGIIFVFIYMSSLTILMGLNIFFLISFIAILVAMFIRQKKIYDKIAEIISSNLEKLSSSE